MPRRAQPATVKTLKINGLDVGAHADETLLELAAENGIQIPTLCHRDGLSDVGACRMCLVEVKGWGKLVPACMTHPEEGMEIETETPKLKAYRKLIPRNALCRAQSRLCRLRRQRPLRSARSGGRRRHDPRPRSLSISRSRDRCFA